MLARQITISYKYNGFTHIKSFIDGPELMCEINDWIASIYVNKIEF